MDYDVKPLTDVMNTLLGEQGCPWDKEQTHMSLRRNLLEEAHEVIEAIDCNDMAHLKEELGDVLLQVVFHAKLAEQEQAFNFNDVVEAITQKMIRRHPHIFSLMLQPMMPKQCWPTGKKSKSGRKPVSRKPTAL